MPRRFIQFEEGYFYHVYNRGVNKQPIFNTSRDYSRAIETVKFYLPKDVPLRYSKFLQLDIKSRSDIIKEVSKQNKRCNLISFCLMPNHFHFLIKENSENGLRSFIRNFQISYTKYFNTKYNRVGPLLQGQFKSVLIEDDTQLVHLSRYIHLNPASSGIISNEKLSYYPWSSLQEYLSVKKGVCEKAIILNSFPSREKYKNFVYSRANYQKKLNSIKHLTLEN